MLFPKLKPKRNKDYIPFVQNRRCIICNAAPPVDAHHVFAEGMGTKCSDYETIPLCNKHHREFHDTGRKEFAKLHNLDYYREFTKCLSEYIEQQRIEEENEKL